MEVNAKDAQGQQSNGNLGGSRDTGARSIFAAKESSSLLPLSRQSGAGAAHMEVVMDRGGNSLGNFFSFHFSEPVAGHQYNLGNSLIAFAVWAILGIRTRQRGR